MPPVTRSSYQYTSLKDLPGDTIRLLTLSPGNGKEVIVCDLTNTSLSDEVEFAALSYEWGPIDRGYEILLGGKKFRVRKNLKQCLLHLRHRQLSICFWIDAICVNQADLAERGQQVALMGAIYGNAMLVVAWLGAEPAPCNDRLTTMLNWRMAQWLEEFVSAAQKCSTTVQALAQPAFLETSSIAPELLREQWAYLATVKGCLKKFEFDRGDPTEVLEAWNFILDIVFRSYWSRIWILQEVLLAKRLLLCFGRQVIPATSFRSLQETYMAVRLEQESEIANRDLRMLSQGLTAKGFDHAASYDSPTNIIIQQMPLSAGSVLRKSPLQELMFTYEQECTDDRDQVYALLGLADDCDGFEADYTINCADLFWKTLERSRHELWDFEIARLQTALLLTTVSLRTEQVIHRLSEDICSIRVTDWATTSNVLFTKSVCQPVFDSRSELQYHSFVLLSTTTNVMHPKSESVLAFIISRTPISSHDLVFDMDGTPIYSVFEKIGTRLVTKGRAYPINSNRYARYPKSGRGMPSPMHKANYGFPQAPIEVSRAFEADGVVEAEGWDAAARVAQKNSQQRSCRIRVDRSLILEICEQVDWAHHQGDMAPENSDEEDSEDEYSEDAISDEDEL